MNPNQCKYFIESVQRQCVKPADPQFPTCSMTHGVPFKHDFEWMKRYQTGEVSFRTLDVHNTMSGWSVEKAEHYAQLV